MTDNTEITKIKVDLARIDERVGNGFIHINDQLKELRDNHLFHIAKDIKENRDKNERMTNDLEVKVNRLRSSQDKMGVKLAFIMAGVSILIQIGSQILFK